MEVAPNVFPDRWYLWNMGRQQAMHQSSWESQLDNHELLATSSEREAHEFWKNHLDTMSPNPATLQKIQGKMASQEGMLASCLRSDQQ